MNIVYLHQYFMTPDQPGGTRSYEMARRLVEAGHSVNMITTNQNPAHDDPEWRITDEAGITVHWKKQGYSNGMSFASRLKAFVGFAIAASRRAASHCDADLIFATSTPLTIAIPAIYASWRLKKPYVFEVRDIWPAVPIEMGVLKHPVLKWLAYRLEHLAYHHADHVVALAPGMGQHVEQTGYPTEQITVIPNGCDNNIFGVTTSFNSLKEYNDWLGMRPLIVYAGAIGKINGVGYLVDVAKAMTNIDPDIRFVVIGSGRELNQVRERAMTAQILDKNIKIIPAMPKKELAEWVQRSTLCLALIDAPKVLWKDAVQNKFFDALAAGKPVISNKRGWQNEIAEQYDIGTAMPDNDPVEAANLLWRFARDKNWLEGASSRAQRLAAGRFNRDVLARQLEDCLTKVITKSD